MKQKRNHILLTAGFVLLMLMFIPLSIGATESRVLSEFCGVNEEVTIIFFPTTAQLEPVGGMTISACSASASNTAWGAISPFYAVSCQPGAACE